MSYSYQVEWVDGMMKTFKSNRLVHPKKSDTSFVVYVNPHGHDGRYDEVLIPLNQVRCIVILEEVR